MNRSAIARRDRRREHSRCRGDRAIAGARGAPRRVLRRRRSPPDLRAFSTIDSFRRRAGHERRRIAEQARLARDLIAGRRANASAPLTALYANLVQPLETPRAARRRRGTRRRPARRADVLALCRAARVGHRPLSRRAVLDPHVDVRVGARAIAPSTIGAATSGNEVFAPLTKELPASRDEAAAVSRALTANPRIDADASELAVRGALHDASIVHVASHGTLDADRPMFSAVVLARPRARRTRALTTMDD